MNNLLTIIREEIENFDFLRTNQRNEEQETINIIKNYDFQTQFIQDYIKQSPKIKYMGVTENTYSSDDFDDWNTGNTYADILYSEEIEYKYDSKKKPIIFDIEITAKETRIIHHDNDYSEIDWLDFQCVLVVNGDEVEFDAFYDCPKETRTNFIKVAIWNFMLDSVESKIF